MVRFARWLAVLAILGSLFVTAFPVRADDYWYSTWAGTPGPRQYSDETIWVELCWDYNCYDPIVNEPVYTVWNYRTTTSYLDWHTGNDGRAAMTRNIASATCGFTVRVDIYVGYEQSQIDSAYLTPRC